jgi:hypothetical protein
VGGGAGAGEAYLTAFLHHLGLEDGAGVARLLSAGGAQGQGLPVPPPRAQSTTRATRAGQRELAASAQQQQQQQQQHPATGTATAFRAHVAQASQDLPTLEAAGTWAAQQLQGSRLGAGGAPWLEVLTTHAKVLWALSKWEAAATAGQGDPAALLLLQAYEQQLQLVQ